MAGKMADGFEQYDTLTDGAEQIGQWLWVSTGAPSTTTVAGPWSTKSLRLQVNQYASWTDGVAAVTWIVGFRFRCVSAPTTTNSMMRLYDATGLQTQVTLGLNVSKQLVIGRGCVVGADTIQNAGAGGPTTVLQTGSTILSTDVWYFIEAKIKISNTVGTWDVYINGSPTAELSGSGADTQVTTTASASHFMLCNTGIGDCFFDDVRAMDDAGSLNNAILGDTGVQTMMPNGEVTGNWTPSTGTDNSLNVDEFTVGPDDDTTYNSASTNVADLFDMEPLYTGAVSVAYIQPMVRVRKTDSGTNTCRINVKSGATTHNGAAFNPGTTYGYFSIVGLDADPNTAVAWTTTALGTIQSGIERTA